MNHRYRSFTLVATLVSLPFAAVTMAHEAIDPLHSTPVETVGSRLAEPSRIHVAELPQGLEVKGVLERRANHKRKSLRGHLDIEVLDAGGKRFDLATLPLRPLPAGPARHDHERNFSVLLRRPSVGTFRVRVRHVSKGMEHNDRE